MKNDYLVLNIKDVINSKKQNRLVDLRESKEIKTAENCGAFIAGGFVRYLLNENENEISNYHPGYGDIDVFLTKNAQKKFSDYNVLNVHKKSMFADNCFLETEKSVDKIQFINHPSLMKDSIYDTLDNFDFVNCKAAICNDKVIVHKELMSLNKQNTLKIKNNFSPLLLSRILKYSRQYGFDKLEPSSIELINDWFIKAKSEFSDHKLHDDHKSYTRCSLNSIKELALNFKRYKNLNVNDINNIMFFLGNFSVRETVWECYDVVEQSIIFSAHGNTAQPRPQPRRVRRVVKSFMTDPIARLYRS
jgi:hypothetical protein